MLDACLVVDTVLATARQPPRLLRDVENKKKIKNAQLASLLSRVHCVREGQRVPNLDCNVTVFGLYERVPKCPPKQRWTLLARRVRMPKRLGCELAPPSTDGGLEDRETGLCVAIRVSDALYKTCRLRP